MKRGVWIVCVRYGGVSEWLPVECRYYENPKMARGHAAYLNNRRVSPTTRYRAVRYVPELTRTDPKATQAEEAMRIRRNRKRLPVGTTGRLCGHDFTVIEKPATRIPGTDGWQARVMLDNGKPDTAYFGDDHVREIPTREKEEW